MPVEDYAEYDGEDPWEEDEDSFDCGMDRSGKSCSLAGTEECDFECPYRDEMYARLKHKKAQK